MDQPTIQGLKKGDAKLQKQVYYRHCDRLMAIALRYVGSVADAEEVLQDTFVRVFEKIADFDPSLGKFEAWSARIAINFALMHLRKNKRFRFEHTDLEKVNISVSNSAPGNLEVEEIQSKIDSLDEKYSVIFNLKTEGYSHQEIADLLGIKTDASKTIFSRARKKLIAVFSSEKPNTKKSKFVSRKNLQL